MRPGLNVPFPEVKSFSESAAYDCSASVILMRKRPSMSAVSLLQNQSEFELVDEGYKPSSTRSAYHIKFLPWVEFQATFGR